MTSCECECEDGTRDTSIGVCRDRRSLSGEGRSDWVLDMDEDEGASCEILVTLTD